MKLAIVGSRKIKDFDISKYISKDVKCIVSGGAIGIDTIAKKYALENNIKLIEFLPDYNQYGKYAPLKRNDKIIKACDMVLAIWDGKSRGTKYSIDKAKELNKKTMIIIDVEVCNS